MQRFIGWIAAGVLIGVAACQERVVSPALVDTVFIEPDAATLEVGKARRFEAVFVDANGNELRGRQVTWSVANPSIAEVDAEGQVTGLTPGETRLQAVVEGREGAAVITVVRRSVAAVRIEPENPTLLLGRSLTLRAVPLDDEGGELNDRSVTWTTRDEAVVPVTPDGVITGRRLGSAVIQAEVEGKQAQATVRVDAPQLSALEVRPTSATLEVDDTIRLAAIGRTEEGDEVHGLPVEWTTENDGVVAVDEGGRVEAVSPGEARVRASFEGSTGEARIAVNVPPAASVRVEPSSASLMVGTTTRLEATARDARGRVVEKAITWSSNNASLATVNDDGVVTGVAPGTTFIVARTEGVRDSAAIIVTPRPVATVEIEPANPTIRVLQEVQLEAILRADNGEVLTGRNVEWSSSNTAVATVSSSGRVSGLLPGQTTITARAEGRSGTTTVTVTLVPPARITVSPASADIAVGGTVRLTATVFDENNNVLDRPVSWSTSAEGVATVDDAGLVTGVAPGDAAIQATSGEVNAAASVRVAAVPIARIVISPTDPEIEIGETVQLQAVAYDANDNPLPDRVIAWSTSDPGVATISNAGLATGVGPGTATVTAAAEGVQASTGVTVLEPPPSLARIEVVPSFIELEEDESVQLTAIVYNSVGSIVDVGVDWSSSNSRVARVTGNGRVTARDEGTATIRARALGLEGTATVRVVDDEEDNDA